MKMLSCGKTTALAGIDFEFDYNDFYKRAVKVAEFLPESVSKVAIFAENSPEWVFACYGAWQHGSAIIPIDAKSNVEEVAFVLSDAKPEIIFTSLDNEQTTLKAIEKSKSTAQVVLLEKFFEDAQYKDPQRDAKIERNEEDLAMIVYTSGTTGNPKGVMLSFRNLRANTQAVTEAKYFFSGIRVLAMLPFHHILPLMGTLVAPISEGGKVVFPKTISPADISEVLQSHPVDMVVSVPRFYELLHTNIMAKIQQSKIASALFAIAKLVDNMKFSQKLFGAIHKKFGGVIKFWISGGAALDKKAWSDLTTLGFAVREGYGMTECAPIITFPRIGKVKMGSTGQALNGVEVRIVDGEITVRGENVTQGYFNRPEETAEAIKNGWLYTGDLGYVDEEGFLFITGRRKEIIVLANGKNVNPAEIEINLQRQSPLILESGVLMYENTLHAIVSVDPKLVNELGEEGATEKIRNEAILPYNRNAPTYKRIIKITLTTEELPRTRVGKLKRHQLAAYIESDNRISAPKQLAPEPRGEVYEQLKTVLAKQISLDVDCDAHMEMDLGLDSLGKISMQCFVQENYGVDVSEKDFEKYSSLRAFAEMVENNRNSDAEGSLKSVSWSDIINGSSDIELNKPNFFHFATVALFRIIAKIMYKIKYEGSLPNTDGALILAPNHQSYVDGVLVTGTLSKTQLYKTYFFAKIRNILKNKLLKKFADNSNVIVMDITNNVKDSIGKVAKALRDGNKVVIFPEGTRTKDGEIAEFKQTFAIIAKEMGVPVVPICISGAFEKIKVGKTFPSFGAEIKVSFLPEMTVQENESYEDFASKVRGVIEEKLNQCNKTKQ